MDLSPLRSALSHSLAADLVESHILPNNATDILFETAWRHGLWTLEKRQRRGALPGVIGHIAESITESILVERGYTPLWHFGGTGGHGVDLLMMTPGHPRVLAVEVKGTLRPGRWPNLRKAALNQMTRQWLAGSDNPGMREWGLDSEDIYGAVFLLNLEDSLFKVGVTADFERVAPVERLEQLVHLSEPVG